ncbi:MAG TPA: hypothetical protein VGM22_15335 [Methylomirabilota bacterium]
MWGPGPWMGPMWGWWWIFPLIGVLVCLFVVMAMVRIISGRGPFACMASHRHESEEIARLRGEVEELRAHMTKQGAVR